MNKINKLSKLASHVNESHVLFEKYYPLQNTYTTKHLKKDSKLLKWFNKFFETEHLALYKSDNGYSNHKNTDETINESEAFYIVTKSKTVIEIESIVASKIIV